MTPDQPKSPERRAELDEAWRALEAGQSEACFTAAHGSVTAEDEALRHEANKLCGMGLFRQERYAEAVPYFAAAAELSSEVTDWFNLVTSSTLAGEVAGGQAAFERALQVQENSGTAEQLSALFMRFYYAQALQDAGEPKLALDQFSELRKIYEELHVTDDTFLHIRGVPFLAQTLRAAVPVFRALGAGFDATAWLEAFASNVDDDGKRVIANTAAELADPA